MASTGVNGKQEYCKKIARPLAQSILRRCKLGQSVYRPTAYDDIAADIAGRIG